MRASSCGRSGRPETGDSSEAHSLSPEWPRSPGTASDRGQVGRARKKREARAQARTAPTFQTVPRQEAARWVVAKGSSSAAAMPRYEGPIWGWPVQRCAGGDPRGTANARRSYPIRPVPRRSQGCCTGSGKWGLTQVSPHYHFRAYAHVSCHIIATAQHKVPHCGHSRFSSPRALNTGAQQKQGLGELACLLSKVVAPRC